VAPPSPKALSKAWPSSASSPAGGAPLAAAGAAASAAPASVRRTWMTFPHFLQRTLTPAGPTFSSEIMYCALQRSQVNFMGKSA